MTIYRLGSSEVNALMGGCSDPDEDIGLHEPVDPNYEDNTELFLGGMTPSETVASKAPKDKLVYPEKPVTIKVVHKRRW